MASKNNEARRDLAITAGIIVTAFGGLTYYANQKIASLVPSPAPPSFTIRWTNGADDLQIVTEVWASTNHLDWYHKSDVWNTNRFSTPHTNAAEFFIIRHRHPDGRVTDWDRKQP